MHRRGLLLGLLAAPAAALAATHAMAAPAFATGGIAKLGQAVVGETPCQYLVPRALAGEVMRVSHQFDGHVLREFAARFEPEYLAAAVAW